MPETLLSPSKILMYGRVLEDILLVQAKLTGGPGGSGAGDNKFLFQQFKSRIQVAEQTLKKVREKFQKDLKEASEKHEAMDNLVARALAAVAEAVSPMQEARLARIYAMSFEGSFYNLPKPAIFLVHGDGTAVPTKGFAPSASPPPPAKPTDMDASGMAAREFEWEGDVKYWEYDKDDLSLRLDVVTGTLDEILVDATLSPTSKYPLVSRGELAARGEVALRGELITRGEMIARNRLRQ